MTDANEQEPTTLPRARAYDRTLRTESAMGTRRRIAEAALELFQERDYDNISLNEIARAAGVSHQTVLNHCKSKAGVMLAAGEIFSERVRELEVDTIPGDIRSVVSRTCARYEVLGDANARWGTMASRAPEVAEGLASGRRGFQAWLEEMLGDLMPGTDEPEERRRVLFGLHGALDVMTWKLFRRDIGLSQEQTEQQMLDLALGVLSRQRI